MVNAPTDIDRIVRHTEHMFFRGDRASLTKDPSDENGYILTPIGRDYQVLEYTPLAAAPDFYRVRLRPLY
jgi:hypothetical protein